jgi:predicted DNA-binding transcriptional regulator AlpA
MKSTRSRQANQNSISSSSRIYPSSHGTPLLLTAVEAAALCRVSERTWRNWDASGHIPVPVRIGRSLFWRPKELADWVEAGCPDRHTWNVRRN